MSSVSIVWDGSSETWANIFKTSPEIRAGLEKYTQDAAKRNTAALNGAAHAPFKDEDAFIGRVVVADKTQLGKVVAGSYGAKVAGSAHGIPSW